MNWKEYVNEMGETEVTGEAHIRMMILTFAAGNWVMLVQILMYIGDVKSGTEAAMAGIYYMTILFVAYVVILRLPVIARYVQTVIDTEPTTN